MSTKLRSVYISRTPLNTAIGPTLNAQSTARTDALDISCAHQVLPNIPLSPAKVTRCGFYLSETLALDASSRAGVFGSHAMPQRRRWAQGQDSNHLFTLLRWRHPK